MNKRVSSFECSSDDEFYYMKIKKSRKEEESVERKREMREIERRLINELKATMRMKIEKEEGWVSSIKFGVVIY